MSSEPVLRISGLRKSFRLYRHAAHRLFQLFTRRQLYRNLLAIDDISFTLQPGEFLGIIGENGSGKSTLLKLVAGVLLPDDGQIWSKGKITGLLELGTGFNPELSGRQNIYLNGLYLDMDRAELATREKTIIDFAELEKSIDEPLKCYSSGMIMRLAFSIAIHASPECFIIDEALSVGDIRFQQKCFEKLRQFRAGGGSILFVSHDMNTIKLFCDKVLLLHQGRARHYGDAETAVNLFNEIIAEKGDSGKNTSTGYGNASIYFTEARVEDDKGKPCSIVVSGNPMSVSFTYACKQPVEGASFGISIRDRFGQDAFGTNGALLGITPDITCNGSGRFHFGSMNLGPGIYTINLAAHTGTTHLENCFHWWDQAATFEIVPPEPWFAGHTRLPVELEINNNGEI